MSRTLEYFILITRDIYRNMCVRIIYKFDHLIVSKMNNVDRTSVKPTGINIQRMITKKSVIY